MGHRAAESRTARCPLDSDYVVRADLPGHRELGRRIQQFLARTRKRARGPLQFTFDVQADISREVDCRLAQRPLGIRVLLCDDVEPPFGLLERAHTLRAENA